MSNQQVTDYEQHQLEMLLWQAHVHEKNGRKQAASEIREWVADFLSSQSEGAIKMQRKKERSKPGVEQGEEALNTAKNKAEYQRQVKIDADIDEVIKTIRALGRESDENGDPFTRLMFRRMPVFGEPLDTQIRKLRSFMCYHSLRDWFQQYWNTPPDQLERIVAATLTELRRRAKAIREENAVIRELVLVAVARERELAEFRLFGRGHEPRVTLDGSLAAILRGLDLPRVTISGFGANNYYPSRVFKRAITLLKRRLKRSPIAFDSWGGSVHRVCH